MLTFSNLKNLIFSEDLITESKVVASKQLNLCIYINPDRGRISPGIEYFKLYNNVKYGSADKMARIRFRDAIYEHHKRKGRMESK